MEQRNLCSSHPPAALGPDPRVILHTAQADSDHRVKPAGSAGDGGEGRSFPGKEYPLPPPPEQGEEQIRAWAPSRPSTASIPPPFQGEVRWGHSSPTPNPSVVTLGLDPRG